MTFNVKEDIMKAINGTDDPALRTVFMLMLSLFESLNEKLDKAIGNEMAMRQAVLNGHEPVHHNHHEWIERRIKREPEIDEIVAWAKERKAAEETAIGRTQKIGDGVIQSVIAAALIGALGYLAGRGGF